MTTKLALTEATERIADQADYSTQTVARCPDCGAVATRAPDSAYHELAQAQEEKAT